MLCRRRRLHLQIFELSTPVENGTYCSALRELVMQFLVSSKCWEDYDVVLNIAEN